MSDRRRARLDAVLARRQPDLTVFAENLHKTRNFSAMVRTCDAVGINEVHVYQEEDGLRRHWNTSQGAEKWLRVHAHESPAEACSHLQAAGYKLVAAHLGETAVDYRDVDYTQPVALVLGTELFGVSEATLAMSDTQVRIPMMGVTQSLNVSVACAVVLFEALRQRQAAGLYDRCRLDQAELARQRFEWLHPVLADYCNRHGLAYPALDEEGELSEPMPRADADA